MLSSLITVYAQPGVVFWSGSVEPAIQPCLYKTCQPFYTCAFVSSESVFWSAMQENFLMCLPCRWATLPHCLSGPVNQFAQGFFVTPGADARHGYNTAHCAVTRCGGRPESGLQAQHTQADGQRGFSHGKSYSLMIKTRFSLQGIHPQCG